MTLYDSSKINNIKYKFKDIEKINQNYSQSYQDMFILSMLDGKKNGIFVEIGAHHPTFISNTFLLEAQFDWEGISIDIDSSAKSSFINSGRRSEFILNDALKISYKDLFIRKNYPKQIDYLQIDIEPMTNTFECLKLMPLDDYRFSVITFETDYYDPNTPKEIKDFIKESSRNLLESKGYKLIVGNICNTSINDPFEDWYIDPLVINENIIKLFLNSREYNNTAEEFMLSK
jgi:hypothetical protein